MYNILIKYETGDSFNSYNEEDVVGHMWSDIEKAKQSLQRIKNHYEYYQKTDTVWYDKKPKNLPEGVGWDYELKMVTLLVVNDNGEEVRINDFWCDYFDTLHSAEIVLENSKNKDMLYIP